MGDVLGRQHAEMYVHGEKGSLFSLEAMRKDAALRLKRGWTTTIHMHTHDDHCPGRSGECEFYEPEKTEKPEENLPCTHVVCAENPMQGCIYENYSDVPDYEKRDEEIRRSLGEQ